MGGDTDGAHPTVLGHVQMVDRADAGDEQRRDARLFHVRHHGLQVFIILVGWKTVVDRRTAETIAMGHFDERHTGGVERAGDIDHLLERNLVTLGMHAVAQAHVVQRDLSAFEIHGRSSSFRR